MTIILEEGIHCQGEVMSDITSLKREDKSLAVKALILKTYSGFQLYFILPQVF